MKLQTKKRIYLFYIIQVTTYPTDIALEELKCELKDDEDFGLGDYDLRFKVVKLKKPLDTELFESGGIELTDFVEDGLLEDANSQI